MRSILIPLLTCSLFAQQPEPPPVTLKTTTCLVEVSVVVHDRKGQPVADLHKEDFQVKLDGHLQPITVFSVDSAGTLPVSTTPLPPNTFTNRLEQRPGTPSTVTIILLDALNTRFADQAYAKRQIVKYLETIQPTDHIGLYALGNSLRVLHDYTSNSTELLRKLAGYHGGDLPSTANPGRPFNGDSLLLDQWLAGPSSPAERSFYMTNRIEGTLHALEFIANHLSRVPGRKNLIWVSGGFPLTIGFHNLAEWNNPAVDQRTFFDEVNRTVQAINDANMAIYPVDARGLMVNPQFSAERGSVNVRRPPAPPPMVGVRGQEAMHELASRTGGRVYINTNDLKTAIRDAVSDSQVTYTLGFYPSNEKYDGKFHEIKLQVPERSGLNLRYRKGYFDLADQPQDENARRAGLRDAVYSPIDATAMGITVELKPSTGPRQYSFDASVKIDRDSIRLEPNGNRWVGKLDLLFIQKDDRGNQYNGEVEAMELNLLKETYDQVTRQGLVYKRTITRDRRASLFRVVVRDAASGSIGSVTAPFNQVH
jgi:VWFA-related protein